MTHCGAVCICKHICAHACIFPVSQYLGIWLRKEGREQRKERGQAGERERILNGYLSVKNNRRNFCE